MDTKTQLTNTDTQDELNNAAFEKLILSEVEGWAGCPYPPHQHQKPDRTAPSGFTWLWQAEAECAACVGQVR